MLSFLINLDRSPERLTWFTAQAARVGLGFERIAGVDGRTLTPAELQSATADSYEFQPINPGEAGLFMSHRDAWQRLLDSDAAHAAVFEDDAVLSQRIATVLDAIDRLALAADVIKLETTRRRVVLGQAVATIGGLHRLQPLCSWHGGTAAYVVSRAGAQLLLQATWPLADPVDQVMFNPMSRVSARLRLLQVCPGVCIQKNILEKGLDDGIFGTTIGRNTTGGRLWRHGPWIDLKRAWLKQRERSRRARLARQPGHEQQVVAFDAPLA